MRKHFLSRVFRRYEFFFFYRFLEYILQFTFQLQTILYLNAHTQVR